jgi:hypothetical protein
MCLKSPLIGIAVTLAFAVFSPSIAHAGLLGSDVTGDPTDRYQGLFEKMNLAS